MFFLNIEIYDATIYTHFNTGNASNASYTVALGIPETSILAFIRFGRSCDVFGLVGIVRRLKEKCERTIDRLGSIDMFL
jgi:hypothetical protein